MHEMLIREVNHFMDIIEEGNSELSNAYNQLLEFDPLLTHFLLRYLHDKHPITDRNAGPGRRLLELVTTYKDIARLANPPKNEPIIEWFEDSYNVKDFFTNREEFVSLIVEKLEG